MAPMIDIHTIGAGGGSIAHLDAGGAFHVGPQSAGAMPGPAAGSASSAAVIASSHVPCLEAFTRPDLPVARFGALSASIDSAAAEGA